MASFVWQRDPEEAYRNPYEYSAQEQFVREASAVLTFLYERLNPRQLRFQRDERSRGKAIWMLYTDTLDSMAESLTLLGEKRHRPAARLFRDAIETGDLAYWLAKDAHGTEVILSQWFDDQSPRHSRFRSWLRRRSGDDSFAKRKALYGDLSRYVHRTHRALLKSYSVGAGDMLVHDQWSSHKLLVLPHTIAAYYAILAMVILQFVEQLTDAGRLSIEEAVRLWDESLEKHTVERCFAVA